MSQFTLGGWGLVPPELLAIHKKVSVSGVIECYESPAHFESKYILKESEETDAMRLGTAIHMAILEPEKFLQSYVEEPSDIPANVLESLDQLKEKCVAYGLKKSGTKAELLQVLIDNGHDFVSYDSYVEQYRAGRELMKPKDWRAAQRIVARIKSKKMLNYLISGGEPEKLAWALHERTGLIISFKADYFKTLKAPVLGCEAAVTDAKKVPSVKKRRFEAMIWDRSMFIQAALYVDLLEALTKKKTLFNWLAVDAKPPYPVMGYPADFGLLEAGRNEYNKTLDTLVECFKTNVWPDYSNELQTVTMPKYAWDQLEYRDDEYAE